MKSLLIIMIVLLSQCHNQKNESTDVGLIFTDATSTFYFDGNNLIPDTCNDVPEKIQFIHGSFLVNGNYIDTLKIIKHHDR